MCRRPCWPGSLSDNVTDPKRLQLPSQRQLVDRLLHLTEFGNPFVLLAGEAGSGRSTLLAQLGAQLPATMAAIGLNGSEPLAMAQVRDNLLRQLVPHPVFNPADALADSFLRLTEGRYLQCALLIDDIDKLPHELLGELWALMLANEALPRPHRLAIVASAASPWCQQHHPLLKGGQSAAIEVEIEPLRPPEQKIFLYEKSNLLKVPSLLLTKEKVVEILDQAKGHPATIMTSLEDLMTDRRPRKRPESFPVRKVALGLAATAAGLLALTYLVPAIMGPDKPLTPVVEPLEGNLPPPVADEGAAAPIAQASSGAEPVARQWAQDQARLPDQADDNTITVESQNYEGRRVVIGDEVVQQLMGDKPVSGALPTDVAQAIVPAPAPQANPLPATRSQPPVAAPAPIEPPKPATQPKSAPKVEAKPEPAPKTSDKLALTPVRTLTAKPGNHFSVQLMGASHMQAVEQFVTAHDLHGKVWIYQTQFRGGPWFVVLMGDHASLAKARAAVRALPPPLLKEQPWPKSFAQVKKELKK